jgi:DUF4097 and DUF4098 domain-containing protein YvlB
MKIMFLLLVACVLTSGSAYSEEFTRTETLTVPISSGDLVEIYNINGDISIEEWNSEDVQVEYTITCPDEGMLELIQVECTTDDGLECNVEYSEDCENYDDSRVDFKLNLPSSSEVSVELAFVNGDINLTGCSGSAQLELVNGSIEVTDYSGILTSSMVNGDMTVLRTPGLSSTELVSGTIDCQFSSLEDDVIMESVSGDINIILDAPAMVLVETISGSINIADSFNAEISENYVGRSTQFGDGDCSIQISTVSGNVSVSD